jgi:DNA-directed RNA polymerase subunit beta'
MLDEEMADRPVLLNRAPTWHKFNLLAFYPKRTKGSVLYLSPLVTKGFTADADGDQMNFHVPVSDKAVAEAKEKMLPSRNLFSLTDMRSVRHSPSMEMTMGLFQATQPASKKPVKVFKSVQAAKHAYNNGEIAINDPIEIRGGG